MKKEKYDGYNVGVGDYRVALGRLMYCEEERKREKI